jgi:hypothetical protein
VGELGFVARIITSENPTVDARRYLRHWANEAFVADRLRSKHPALGSDRRRMKSRHIAVFIEQGVEFLESAAASAVLTKPLALFYAAESLAKAACIFRVEGADATSFASHGLSGERKTKRYSIKNLACRVQRPGRDVWSQLFREFNSDRVRIARQADREVFTHDWVNSYATKPPAKDSLLQLGELLRHLPELVDDLAFTTWGNAYVVHASNLWLIDHPGTPATQELHVTLRHGHDRRMKDMIVDRESDLLRRFTRQRDTFDVLEYRMGPAPPGFSGPNLRLDVFGEPYMDFARGTRVFGELILYHASLFILSDVVRYQPEQWLRLLDDHRDEAIVIERFLDVAVRKLPNLILNELSEQLFMFKFAR